MKILNQNLIFDKFRLRLSRNLKFNFIQVSEVNRIECRDLIHQEVSRSFNIKKYKFDDLSF